jgi:hypothetical protein
MGTTDLHVHTTASDGTLVPTEVVKEAAAEGVTLLGITDHDTIEGVAEALRGAPEAGLQIVPGVELSVGQEQQEIHILGYCFDQANALLTDTLARMRQARDNRNATIVEKLHHLGKPICLERVQKLAQGGSVGRPHIAKALVEAGHVTSEGEAFGRFLARGKPAYFGRERLSPAEAARLIQQAGGYAVLAHPGKLGSRKLVEQLLEDGLDGLEVYHTDHTQSNIQLLLEIARARKLLITGGSDSHGPHSERPLRIGSVTMPAWVQEQFIAAISEG